MALEAQGILIKMADGTIATAATGAVGLSSHLEFVATGIQCGSDTLDFTSDFSSGMRIKSNSTASTSIFTVKAVATTLLTLHENDLCTASTIVDQVRGYTMNTIGQVISFSGPSGSPAVIDITNFSHTYKEKMVGVVDEGQMTFEIIYSSTAGDLHNALNDERKARTKRFYELELTDGTLAGSFLFFEAYVSAFSISGAVDDAIKGSITLDITNEVHWTRTTR